MGVSFSKTVSWLAGPQSMFKNVVISGGQFLWARTVNQFIQQPGPRPGLELLTKHVVPSAMHDSAQRVDPPRCHPNTRDAILEQIFQWIIESEDREKWLLWLNGAVGAGKSAIAQSIAERCVREKVAVASFFFSKSESARDNAAGLVATLVYQLIQQIPQTEDDILGIIEQDPLIFDKSFESQLKALILNPLIRIQHLHGRHLLLLITDGLDECKDMDIQSNLILGFANLARNGKLPLIFLIASRCEAHIVASFKTLENETPNTLMKLPLDDVQQASDGIRNLLNDKFAEIKRTHAMGDRLPEDWPSSSVVERIVAKSSGQFIYASLVVKFVSSPRYHPLPQLEIIDGLRPPNLTKHPLAHLDTLYRAIFSQIEPDKLAAVFNILAFALLTGENDIAIINWAFEFTSGEVEMLLSDLAAVITCTSTKDIWPQIRFLHASLSEFLLDINRSGAYHISPEKYTTELAGRVLSQPPMKGVYYLIIRLLETVKPSAEIHDALLQYDPKFEDLLYVSLFLGPDISPMFSILVAVKNLNFDNQTVYDHFLDLVMRYFENESRIKGTKRHIYMSESDKQQFENDNELRNLANRLNQAGILVHDDIFRRK